MARRIPGQLVVGLVIVVVGGGLLAGEYGLVNWYPLHQARVRDEELKLLPYRNDSLGIEVQVASALYGRIESFPGGVRIYRPKLLGTNPSLTITSQSNPGQSPEFSPQILAVWQTDGALKGIPRYHFEHTNLNGRDAALIWQFRDLAMMLTAHVISRERIVEADCTPGRADEDLYLAACESSLRSLKISGSPPSSPPTVQEVSALVGRSSGAQAVP